MIPSNRRRRAILRSRRRAQYARPPIIRPLTGYEIWLLRGRPVQDDGPCPHVTTLPFPGTDSFVYCARCRHHVTPPPPSSEDPFEFFGNLTLTDET